MRFLALIIIIFCTGVTGCSHGEGSQPVAAPIEGQDDIPASWGETSHMSWGLWQFIADPAAGTLDAKPLRQGAIHLNALKFLEPPPLAYITFESKPKFSGDIVDVDIGLRHPFLGQTQYSGFDVCGILISNGSLSGFEDGSIIIPWKDDTCLVNADGYSPWWNPVNFPPDPVQPVNGYIDGMLGVPESVGNYNATVCGYKYFADGLDKDAPLDELDLTMRGSFAAGQQNIRHYKIHIGSSGLVFNYAIDASWKFPSGQPPWEVPDSFPISANRPEAFYITVTETENSLYYVDDTNKGGQLKLEITVYDWQGPSTIKSVGIEWPGIFPYEETTPFAETELSAYYRFELSGDSLASTEPVGVLVTARDSKTHPKLGNIPAYQLVWGFKVGNNPGTQKEERIVYCSDYNSALIGRNIYSIDPEGLTDPVQWTTQDDPATWCEGPGLSPDGKYILYLRYSWSTLGSELRRVDVTTKDDISLSDGMSNWYTYGSWRHDGQKIVYSYANSIFENGELYIMDLDGANKTALTPTGLYPWAPVYSHDDQSIIFQSFLDNQIYFYDVATGNITPYTDTPSGVWNDDPVVSPDGQYIAWSTSYPDTGGRKIYISPMTSWNPPWKVIDFEMYIRSPAFSVDGNKVAFDHGGDQSSEIGVYDLTNDTWKDITENAWGDYQADWGMMIISE